MKPQTMITGVLVREAISSMVFNEYVDGKPEPNWCSENLHFIEIETKACNSKNLTAHPDLNLVLPFTHLSHN